MARSYVECKLETLPGDSLKIRKQLSGLHAPIILMEIVDMKKKIFCLVSIGFLLCGFSFPNEKDFLSQKVANIEVFDASGKTYELYSLLTKKPLIISPIYTKCYSICGVVSGGLQSAINGLGTLGKDFNMISFSFDSTDTPKDLADYESRWKMDGKGWRTLSASGVNIRALMKSLDYQYDYIASNGEYDHPSILIILSPSGKISRYIYGVNPSKKDIEIAVLEASAEKTRPGILKGFYLRCLKYDPLLKTYKMDWRFIISTSAGLVMILGISTIFIRSFIITKHTS